MLKTKKLVIAAAACAFAAVAALTACTGTSQPASNSNANSNASASAQSQSASSGNENASNAAVEAGKKAAEGGVEIVEKVAGSIDYSLNYFGVVATTPSDGSGTLSSAVKVIKFASECGIGDEGADIAAIRDEMLNAYEGMSDEGRANFDARFMDIVKFIDAAAADPDSVVAPDDASVDTIEEFKTLLADEDAMAAWNKLMANTMTIGNSTGE